MTQPDVPEPTRSGVNPVRWQQVLAGFGIAMAVMWGIRIVLWVLVACFAGDGEYAALMPSIVAWFVPIPVLVGLIWWNARRGREGRAIGMAIYAGLAALVLTACFSTMAL
ncbi:MAG: hypothetical protein K8T90_04815 [Planctomycetes bacterium]|nr:hypothetical protein [Planctomycetota bacterium]